MKLPKGVRQNNPGNIEFKAANKWQGQVERPPGERFAAFASEVWGIRALAVLLITYFDKHDADTVLKIISRWAPEHENPTDRYAAHVANYASVTPTETINVHDYTTMLGLVKGIITFENGPGTKYGKPKDWYPQETYDEALKRAGVVSKAETKRTTNDVAQGAAAATVSVAGAWEAGKSLLAVNSERAQSIGATVLFIAMAISVVAWWRHNKRRRAERL